jgi:hypothetical protein
MFPVARAVSCARSFTSVATTAKPLPAAPARAASIVALSARRLVCAAIELISLTTDSIWLDDWSRLASTSPARAAHRTARSAVTDASDVSIAICWMAEPISAEPVATADVFWLISRVLSDTVCTSAEDRDALRFMRSAAEASPSEVEDNRATVVEMPRIDSPRRPRPALSAAAIRPTSSRPPSGNRPLRSPSATPSRTATVARSGREISRPTTTTSAADSMTASPIRATISRRAVAYARCDASSDRCASASTVLARLSSATSTDPVTGATWPRTVMNLIGSPLAFWASGSRSRSRKRR